MEFDSVTGQLLEFYTSIGPSFPAHVADFGIGGDVECTLFDGKVPLLRRVIPLENWNKNEVIRLGVQPREDRQADFQVLGPQGKPMRYASVTTVHKNGNGMGSLDGYGMGISAAYDIEVPIYFSKRGYHPSQIITLKDLIEKNGGVISMGSARQLVGDTDAFREFNESKDLYCAGIRDSDGLVFERYSVDGQFKMFDCPIGSFLVEFSTDAWEFQFACGEMQDSLELVLPNRVNLRITLDQHREISRSSISRIEFMGASGNWTAKKFVRIPGDDRSFDLSIPGFRDLALIQVHLQSGEVIEIPPSIYEDGAIWRLSL